MKKNIIVFLIVLVMGAMLINGCGNGNNEENTEEETVIEGNNNEESLTDWCEVGAFTQTQYGEARITGFEEHQLGTNTVELCCLEVDMDYGEGVTEKGKLCYDEDNGNIIHWKYDEAQGKNIKQTEMYEEGNNICSVFYNPDGSILAKSCVPQ